MRIVHAVEQDAIALERSLAVAYRECGAAHAVENRGVAVAIAVAGGLVPGREVPVHTLPLQQRRAETMHDGRDKLGEARHSVASESYSKSQRRGFSSDR